MADIKKISNWESVKGLMNKHEVLLGRYLSYHFTNTPRRILYSMSYYKFAAKIIGSDKRVLDIGCGEGLGTWLLKTECGYAKGIDMDKDAIDIAKENWQDSEIDFVASDFLSVKEEQYDAIAAFDLIEHILVENIPNFFKKVISCLTHDGVAVIGTPNITSHQYASDITKKGHVNIYSSERLEKEMMQYFSHVFMFGANDEVVHTGFLPMAHYLIAVACRNRGRNIERQKE